MQWKSRAARCRSQADSWDERYWFAIRVVGWLRVVGAWVLRRHAYSVCGGRSVLAIAAVASLQLAGCALPWEQLQLPGPLPTAGERAAIAQSNQRKGVPMSDAAGEPATEARIFKGSGAFAATPQASQSIANGPVSDGVTLNLVGASVNEAAKTILGDILRVSYIVSDKVKASITIQTARPVAREALLEIFEAVLRTQGAAIVVDKGLHKVVTLEDGLAAGLPIRAQGATRGMAGLQTQIVPLQYIAAAEMERIIKAMAPQALVLRADSARNLIVISGNRSDLASLNDIVNMFDVDWMRGMSFALFPVETSDPEAIAQELDTVFANDRDGPTKGIVRFVPNRRLKSILVISSRPEYVEKAERWLKRIDLVGKATEKQVHVYHVQNRSALELAQLLQRVYNAQEQGRAAVSAPGTARQPTATLSSSLASPDTGARFIGESAPAPPVFQAVPGVPAVPTPVARVPGAPAGPAGELVSAPGPAPAEAAARPAPGGAPPPDDRSSGITVVADEPNNVLVITATPSEYRRARQVLERIDVMPNQVLLEATIAEVTLNDSLKFGLRWFFERGQSQFKLSKDELGVVAPAFPGFSYFLNSPNVQVALSALSAVTDVNVVSSPSLMVLDNKKAVLQVGDEVPIATQSAVSVLTPGAPIVNSITFRNTGVILGITPRIGDNGRVLLEIEQEVSDVVATTTSTLNSPTIQQRRVKTTVAVQDGETLVLAGMMQDRATNTREQVPVLGGLPVIGNLFKNKTDTITRTELLIAITPRVVKNDNQIRAIAAEMRDKLNFTTRPQRQAAPSRKEQIDRLAR